MTGILGILTILATLAALRSMHRLWSDRQAEIDQGRDDGTSPWLLTRVVILCAGATLIGLWLSVLSIFAMIGIRFPFTPPLSYLIGLSVTLLPTFVAWEFSRLGKGGADAESE